MPKDNENLPLSILTPDGPAASSEPKAFAPDQLIDCEKCLRKNPPTRAKCLYCGAVLTLSDDALDLQRPTLGPLEKWEQGYNNILLPSAANAPQDLSEADEAEAVNLLKLAPTDLARILSSGGPLPVARTGSIDEAHLIQRRLRSFGLETRVVSDAELNGEIAPVRVRAVDIDDESLWSYQTPESTAIQIAWSDFVLFVPGRLLTKRLTVTEQKASRTENRILDSSEFFNDETVLDFYTRKDATTYRINANSFDFSCLGTKKKLLVAENMSTLVELFRSRAPQAEWDDSYHTIRKVLDAVWPAEQHNESSGWRRDRPGKHVIGSTTEVSNESQFLKYSRLRYHFLRMSPPETNEDA
ncbi:MAG: zinc finger Ran-binding domain-containing protein [Acidobacteriota bacterium]|nr:zinc finger Ran-binding domain-containing protein [Acidobacteriota bacterium]